MDKLELQKLRDLPIEGVAERLGLSVTHHKCLCPFHDDHHASMSFKVSKNTCRCFVCMTQSIGPIDLVMKYLNKDFREACRWLAEGGVTINDGITLYRNNVITSYRNNGITLSRYNDRIMKEAPPFDASRYERFFERPWLNEEARKFLFEERRLDPRVVRWCRLTSWKDKRGVPWLQIPYYDRKGKLVGIQNRNLVKGALPRFRFLQGAQCGIYNLPVLNLLKSGDELWITEGCSDCWAMLSAGHKAIAIPSATLLSKKDQEMLSTLHSTFGRSPDENAPLDHRSAATEGAQELSIRFAMYPDADTPGERLFLQLKELLPDLVRHQLPVGCKDFSEYYVRLGSGRQGV